MKFATGCFPDGSLKMKWKDPRESDLGTWPFYKQKFMELFFEFIFLEELKAL